MHERIDQTGCFVGSLIAVGLLTYGIGWGSVVGLVAQVFWFRTTHRNGQWGIFALAVGYTLVYAAGVVKWLAA